MDPSRVSIRPFKLSDVDDVLKWASDIQVTWHSRLNPVKTKEEALEHLEKYAIPHPWRRSICVDDRSIGYISVRQFAGNARCRAKIGYALSAEYWGQGVAPIAVKMTLSSVFRDMPELVRLEAIIQVENKRSQRVVEKVGFVKEGLLRKYIYVKGGIVDCFVYSILSTDNV